MRRYIYQILLTGFSIVISTAIPAIAQEEGNVQIACESGVQVYLDGEFKGTTNDAMGGYALTGVTAGKHIIVVSKEGYQPKSRTIEVRPGRTEVVRFGTFDPVVSVTYRRSESDEIVATVGALEVESIPINCTIEVILNGDPYTTLQLTADTEAAVLDPAQTGRYEFRFKRGARTLSYGLELHAGVRKLITANWIQMEVSEFNLVFEDKQATNDREEAVRRHADVGQGASHVGSASRSSRPTDSSHRATEPGSSSREFFIPELPMPVTALESSRVGDIDYYRVPPWELRRSDARSVILRAWPNLLVSDDIPAALNTVEPEYPDVAQRGGVEGRVIVAVLVDEEGQVAAATVIVAQPPGIFELAALRSVAGSRFEPTIRNGRAVPVTFSQIIRFQNPNDG